MRTDPVCSQQLVLQGRDVLRVIVERENLRLAAMTADSGPEHFGGVVLERPAGDTATFLPVPR
jgi:hypothetical protein